VQEKIHTIELKAEVKLNIDADSYVSAIILRDKDVR
jgi:hypothetical protein